MKAFDEKDLITWANRDKAVIGSQYYFANSLTGMQIHINNGTFKYELDSIDEDNLCTPFNYQEEECHIKYSCILPIDAVKEENKYRPCKTIQEFFELVTGNRSLQSDEQCSLYLVGCKLHLRNKENNEELFSQILEIRKGIFCSNEYLHVLIGYNGSYTFEDCFECFEIEINGEWVPCGVLED